MAPNSFLLIQQINLLITPKPINNYGIPLHLPCPLGYYLRSCAI